MPGITNTFSWSKKRASIFDTCQRQYFNQYYGSWGGWQGNADEHVRSLYIHKQLMGYEAWVGTIVHDALATALREAKQGVTPSLDRSLSSAQTRIFSDYANSQNRGYRTKPKTAGLLNHELQLAVPSAHRAFLKASECLVNAFESDKWQEVLAAPVEQWHFIDEKNTFTLDGITIWAVPDFLYTRSDGLTEIIDWKTGKPRADDTSQVVGYAAFTTMTLNVPIESLMTSLVYLAGGAADVISAPVDRVAIAAYANKVRTSVAAMKLKLVDQDVQRNEPLLEDQFDKTTNTWQCQRCNFRPDCWPGGLGNGSYGY